MCVKVSSGYMQVYQRNCQYLIPLSISICKVLYTQQWYCQGPCLQGNNIMVIGVRQVFSNMCFFKFDAGLLFIDSLSVFLIQICIKDLTLLTYYERVSMLSFHVLTIVWHNPQQRHNVYDLRNHYITIKIGSSN